MSVIDSMMDTVIKRLSQEKRETMMINMMPMMMEGIDINTLMPRMMTGMIKNITVDDVIGYLTESLRDRASTTELVAKLQSANLMQAMMFRVDKSVLTFEETVEKLQENAKANGWSIPDTRDLQAHYHQAGLVDMTRCTILYFCNPKGGFDILTGDDRNKAMSAMMPIGISVYETTTGEVHIAGMNLSLMSNFFGGVINKVLKDGGERYEKSLEGIVE